jgi:hypothetical protein
MLYRSCINPPQHTVSSLDFRKLTEGNGYSNPAYLRNNLSLWISEQLFVAYIKFALLYLNYNLNNNFKNRKNNFNLPLIQCYHVYISFSFIYYIT